MILDWQTLIALVIVLFAACLLVARSISIVKKWSSGIQKCADDGCGSCSANQSSDRAPRKIQLVNLEESPSE